MKYSIFRNIFSLYIDGFKNMKTGKLLWKIIAFKFIVFILIMKIFFFPNFLKTNFDTDEQRSSHVLENLTKGL
ncbi:DUF4492 domain-containing protein [Arcobacter sp. 15-2]|uniref:DUF4492 domain-containing protein n=1 Tax=Arcobacter sp. 15-2 TaxID=3374109 RepID=UPI00399CE5F3